MLKVINGQQMLVDDETGEIIDEIFWKTPFNHDTNQESDRTALYCKDESKTDQSFKEDADINVIMDRVRKGAELPITLPEHFGDGTNIPTLLDAFDKIAENNKVFYNLDPRIREEFQNDPRTWMAAVAKDLDKGDLDNLARMGIDIKDLTVTGFKPPGAAAGSTSPAGTPEGAPEGPGAASAPAGAKVTP